MSNIYDGISDGVMPRFSLFIMAHDPWVEKAFNDAMKSKVDELRMSNYKKQKICFSETVKIASDNPVAWIYHLSTGGPEADLAAFNGSEGFAEEYCAKKRPYLGIFSIPLTLSSYEALSTGYNTVYKDQEPATVVILIKLSSEFTNLGVSVPSQFHLTEPWHSFHQTKFFDLHAEMEVDFSISDFDRLGLAKIFVF